MELVAGYPYWLIKTGLSYQYPHLLDNQKCQVVIIGGGISGALTAYYCTNAGMDCMLVDGRAIGLGSTCASTSLLQYELDIPLHQLIKKVGSSRATRSYQLCAEAIDKLIVLMDKLGFQEYSKKKSLYFTRHHSEMKMLKKECSARKEAGFAVELLSAEDLQENFHLKAAGGILSEKGASNNVYAFTHALLQHSISNGLRVFDRTRIKSIDQKNTGLVLKTDDGFVIDAKQGINATGYEVVNFIDKGIVNLDSTYAIVSEPQPQQQESWPDKVMMWNTDTPYLYLCGADNNRIIMGGRDEPFVTMRTLQGRLDKKASALEKDFKRYFPSLPFKREFAWSGVFGKTKDSLPYIGAYPRTPGIMYALGFGGNGITFSLIAAEIITDLLRGKKNSDAGIFSFAR